MQNANTKGAMWLEKSKWQQYDPQEPALLRHRNGEWDKQKKPNQLCDGLTCLVHMENTSALGMKCKILRKSILRRIMLSHNIYQIYSKIQL